MIETHCHLDYLKDRPLAETLILSKQAGVEKIITIAGRRILWIRKKTIRKQPTNTPLPLCSLRTSILGAMILSSCGRYGKAGVGAFGQTRPG